jgi:hypothetical protein
MTRTALAAVLFAGALVLPASAQQDRPLSPAGTATAMVGGEWVKDAGGASVYQGGKWIEVIYSRPMLRQRTNIFGSGADYGVAIRAGAPLWRAGANQTTVLKTEVPLAIGGRTVPAGEYGVLVELRSPTEWTLVLTSQPRQAEFDANNKTDLIGAVNYDPKFDVVRAPMRVNSKASPTLDQFTIYFTDVTRTGGTLAMAWEKTVATVEFTVR